MIVCAIDDLFFSIKISTAAKQLGVEVFFERSADRLLDRIREKRPSLLILDLNSAKMNPLAALSEIKAAPDLSGVRTLGYVSHVDTDTIAAARAAGVDQVLARSAFVQRMGEILTTG